MYSSTNIHFITKYSTLFLSYHNFFDFSHFLETSLLLQTIPDCSVFTLTTLSRACLKLINNLLVTKNQLPFVITFFQHYWGLIYRIMKIFKVYIDLINVSIVKGFFPSSKLTHYSHSLWYLCNMTLLAVLFVLKCVSSLANLI